MRYGQNERKKIVSALLVVACAVNLSFPAFAASENPVTPTERTEQILAVSEDGIIVATTEPRQRKRTPIDNENTMLVKDSMLRGVSKPTTAWNVAEDGAMDFDGSVSLGYTLYAKYYAVGCTDYYVDMNIYPNSEGTTVKSTIYVNGKRVWKYKGTGQAFKYVHVYNCKTTDKVYIKWTSPSTDVDGYIDEYDS